MKKILYAATIFLLSSLISCTKEKELNISSVESLSSVSQEVLGQSTIQGIKQAYLMLSNKEKEDLWKAKYATILKNDEGKLTKQQVLLINKLQSFLLENGMDKIFSDSKIGENFIDANLLAFENAFSKTQQFVLVELPYFDNSFSIVTVTDNSLSNRGTCTRCQLHMSL